MKINRALIALVVFILPILATGFWFYAGFAKKTSSPLPDYPGIDQPQPPISTLVALPDPPKSTSTPVLIDMKHGNLVTLSEIDPLLRNIESMGCAIDIYREDGDLSSKLKSASSFLVPVPLVSFSADEMLAVTSFVKRGGRLVVITDPTRNTLLTEGGSIGMTGVDAANLILEPFDLSFNDDYLYNLVKNEGNYRNIFLTDISKDELMKGINQLVIYGGHSLNNNGTPLAIAGNGTFSSSEDQTGSLSPINIIPFDKGQVLAIGDISLMTSQYVQSKDNQVFVRNLAEFLTESTREKTLADFPFLFQADVVIQPAGDLTVDGELLSAITNLEKSVTNASGLLTISQDVTTKGDRILLTTFKINKSTKDILETLKIDTTPTLPTPEPTLQPEGLTPEPKPTQMLTPTLPILKKTLEKVNSPLDFEIPVEKPGFIQIPGMGIIETDGLGIVGLVRDGDRTSLIIMANSQEKIQELINQISSENLKSCLIHDNLAACRISGMSIKPLG
jgi:hypothetical protein